MKKKLTAALVAMSLLLAVGACAEDNIALPGARGAAGEAVAAATPAAQEVVIEEAEAVAAADETALSPYEQAIAAAKAKEPKDPKITEEYRWFVNKYNNTRGRTVRYYDNVYAYNHGSYVLTPFDSTVPAEYFVVDEYGTYAVAPIVLDITDAMRAALYGADQGETYMLYGQYCERIGDGKGHIGFSGIHEGIDFVNYDGAPLYAILGGKVTRGADRDGTIAIYNAEYDCTLLYLHCKNSQVRRGDMVDAGQLVGYEGNTNSGSPYTHVEFRYGEHQTANAYRNIILQSDCPYSFMQMYFGVQESGRQPVTAAAVTEAQRLRAEAEAAALAEAEAEAEAKAEPQIELIDVLDSAEGYGFGATEATTAAPEATLPPAK